MEFTIPYSLNPSIMQCIAMPRITFRQMFYISTLQDGFGYNKATTSGETSNLNIITFNGKNRPRI
ncbi:MAG: hypothetical protein ACP5P3_03690 [Ignavibacteria bacterium]